MGSTSMHQPFTHLWRPGMRLFWYGAFVGEIVSCCAPGYYFVEDQFGHGCVGDEDAWKEAGVEVCHSTDSWWT